MPGRKQHRTCEEAHQGRPRPPETTQLLSGYGAPREWGGFGPGWEGFKETGGLTEFQSDQYVLEVVSYP